MLDSTWGILNCACHHRRSIEPGYVEADYPLSLSGCIFPNPVTFRKLILHKDLTLNGSKVLSPATLKISRLKRNVFCDDSIFEQESLWSGAEIGEKFHALRAEFQASKGRF